jgi:hypothetical protein
MENGMGSKLEEAAQAAPLLQMAYGHGPLPSSSPAAAAGGGGSEGETSTATQQPSSGSNGRVTSTAAKAAVVAAAAAAAGDTWDSDESSGGDIGLLLHRALHHKMFNMVAVTWVQSSTYSKLQLCILHVASWPFGPMGGASFFRCSCFYLSSVLCQGSGVWQHQGSISSSG